MRQTKEELCDLIFSAINEWDYNVTHVAFARALAEEIIEREAGSDLECNDEVMETKNDKM